MIINPEYWKKELPAFKEKTDAFYRGEVPKNEYKGFSGFYGSYAQKGGKSSMLRLRMTGGQVTKEKMSFVADVIKKYNIDRLHFTTCQAIQLHDLQPDVLYPVMEGAISHNIITMGGGGDFPRNVMCPPLSGVENNEYFDVLPYAKIAGEYLMNFIKGKKMPRKLKVCFSNSPNNFTHATFRDLGFVANANGKFDVYSAGGLGNNPKMGVKVAENTAPEKILFYIKAMWLTFCTYGNYENRGKARTRYMQDALGGAENYIKAYNEKLAEVFESAEDLSIEPKSIEYSKKGNGSKAEGFGVIPQKQEGLYSVMWHPVGGQPDAEVFCKLNDYIQGVEGAELRLSPDESAYIINLTGDEANEVRAIIEENTAKTVFETSVSCIGASICQVGLRDSQSLLRACIEAVTKANLSANSLPQIHISGCPSSCGTHQTGALGFRGAVKSVDGKPQPAFILYVNGCDLQGKEAFGHEVGTILADDIPDFIVELGKTVEMSGKKFCDWNDEEYKIDNVAEKFVK